MNASLPERRSLRSWLVGPGVIAGAMAVMNVTTYGFTLVAAHVLGPREYGVVASLMGLLLVLNVVSLGLQATAARRVAAAPGDLAEVEHEVVAASYRAAVALGLVTLVLSPLIAAVLRLDSPWLPVLVALGAVPLTVMGAQAGVLQGERQWGPLAVIYLAVGLGRILLGVLGMLVRQDASGAMVGVALGNVVPAVLGWWLLRRPSRAGSTAPARPPLDGTERRAGRPPSPVLREVAHNSHTLLAFFALANADVLVARVTLTGHQAGLYAGGLILAKAVLFLPQFVVVIAFPTMAERSRAGLHLAALGLVGGLGLCCVAGAALLPGLAVAFVGGADYRGIEDLVPGFALLGTLLALIQMLVYEVVARQRSAATFLIWGALLGVVVAAAFVDSVGSLLATVATIDTLLLVALLAVASRDGRREPAQHAQAPVTPT